MFPRPTFWPVRKLAHQTVATVRALLGREATLHEATRWPRVGLACSGLFFALSGIWILTASERLSPAVSYVLMGTGLAIALFAGRKRLTLLHANLLTLVTHLSALLSFYFLASRFLVVTYLTDTIVGTYAGLFGVLNLQNPYLFSIKPFLDQFSLSPSFYTPRVDGSFEFHLNYPAFNFLSLLPLYLVGLHDLRDGVLFFHIMSLLLVFASVPARAKAVGLAPFVFGLPLAIVYSWTDSVWAFLLLAGAVAWRKDKRLSLAMVGLAGATKQIALVVCPFLLIRLWHETSGSRRRRVLEGTAALTGGLVVPNLPFIISSPSSWWAGTVAAYLPGSVPQIVGGVGLSEILINVGVSAPSGFFFVLMSIVAAGTVLIYARRFTRYSRLAWAMPALILFFYYRSFPNYIIYWLIPLLPELARTRPRIFDPAQTMSIRQASKPASIKLTGYRLRSRLAPSALIVLMVVAVIAGVSGAYISQASEPRVDIRVDRISDTDSIRATTSLEVTLSNHGLEPISPRFFVKWSFLPFLWPADSTVPLEPGASGRYVLTSTDARAAIPVGAPFRVLVFNSVSGNLVSQSPPMQAEASRLTISNPRFKWWTLDSETGVRTPFGWRLFMTEASPSSGVEELSEEFLGGVQLILNKTSNEGRPEMIGVSQKILLDNSSLRMMILRPSIEEQRSFFGVRLSDGVHTLYFAFSPTATSRTVSVHPENTTITLPVEFGTWVWVPIDATDEWSAQDWPLPGTVEFSILLRATSEGVYYGYVRETG